MAWYDDELAALKAERAHLMSTLPPQRARGPRQGRQRRHWWRWIRIGRRLERQERRAHG
jgi:hypothetical protein